MSPTTRVSKKHPNKHKQSSWLQLQRQNLAAKANRVLQNFLAKTRRHQQCRKLEVQLQKYAAVVLSKVQHWVDQIRSLRLIVRVYYLVVFVSIVWLVIMLLWQSKIKILDLDDMTEVWDIPHFLRIPDEEPIVQVINTRFMQYQPNLIELGYARLELLKTICLPTLQQQTSKNFLWIIRADPNLAQPLKQQLMEMIHHVTSQTRGFRVVVLASNDNPTLGFRHDLSGHNNGGGGGDGDHGSTSAMILPNQVWTRNFVLLKHYERAAQTRAVLETRLDADDGLPLVFVEQMQQEALQYLVVSNKNNNNGGGGGTDQENNNKDNWMVWCVSNHWEWQYGAPVSLLSSSSSNSTTAIMERQQREDNKDTNEAASAASLGTLMPGETPYCITPGLTKGYARHVDYIEIPDPGHHRLHFEVKKCKKGSDNNETVFHRCRIMWDKLSPAAIRGRTPTSAGMKHLILGGGKSENKTLEIWDQQPSMWNETEVKFGITRQSVRQMRVFLTEHMRGIVLDNYRGQCTKDHSCKETSKAQLKKLMQKLPS